MTRALRSVEVWHSYFAPLEWAMSRKELLDSSNSCFAKVIVRSEKNIKKKDRPVVGIHYTGPNAGEVIQGFAVAMQCNVR